MSSNYRFQPKNQDTDSTASSFPSVFQARPRDNQPKTSSSFPSVFQSRDRQDRQEAGASQGYRKWKQAEEKKKPLTADDFPPLAGPNTVVTPKAESNGPSLAERLKVTIAKEEEEASMRRFRKEEEPDRYEPVTNLTLSKVFASRALKKKEEEARRRAELDEDEKNYDWQVSQDIERELDDEHPVDSQEDMSCFPADDEEDEETVRPITPLYR